MKKPRPHQRTAIKAVVAGFKTHDRGKLIMACGTGKTLVASWIREALNAGCTLFMAPSIALLAQTLQAWRETSKKPFKALAICSDASVANGRDADDLPAANVGTAVTTDYQDIAKFISSTGKRVILCTYQSSEVLAEAMGLVSVPAFDLAIADEAHRTTGGKGGTFTTITDASAIRATKRLFMTATPRLYFNDDEKDIVSMDNEELYGPVFHELDFAEAIKRKLLSDYEVLVVGVSPKSEQEAERLITKNPRLKVADRTLTARKLAVNIAILRTIKERGLERVITFHNSCSKASAAADFFLPLQDWMPKKYRTATKVWSKTVNHTMDIGDRHELLRQFKTLKGPGILTNARCLGEGVDVPTVDAVVFIDPKKSKIEIVQTVGRAIRLAPGKKKAYIIVPVFMLPGDDQGQIDDKRFKPVIDVLNALRAHDSTLMDELQHWKDRGSHGERGRTGGGEGDEGRKVTFDIPSDCDVKIADWFVTRVARGHTPWADMYRAVFEGVSKNGCLPSVGRLAKWVQRQRDTWTRLRGEQQKSLKALGVGPGLRRAEQWEERARRAFKAMDPTTGVIKVPSLRTWLQDQRTVEDLTDDQRATLEEYFGLPSHIRKAKNYMSVVDAYIAETGFRPPNCNVDSSVRQAAGWVALQLKRCKARGSSLAPASWLDRVEATPYASAVLPGGKHHAKVANNVKGYAARRAEFVRFVSQRKQLPLWDSPLGTWFRRLKHSAQHDAELLALAGRYPTPIRGKITESRIAKATAYIRKTGHRPPMETSLGRWLNKFKYCKAADKAFIKWVYSRPSYAEARRQT